MHSATRCLDPVERREDVVLVGVDGVDLREDLQGELQPRHERLDGDSEFDDVAAAVDGQTCLDD